MSFEILCLTCCSVTLELQNNDVFETSHFFDVYLNGEKKLTTKRNVFTLFGLVDDKDYLIEIEGEAKKIHTKKASYVLHASSFLKANKKDDDTLALQMAISMTPKNGLLVIDPGEYHIKSLFLKSDITIELCKGANLLASTNVEDYPVGPGEIPSNHGDKPLELLAWEGSPFPGKPSIINGFEIENVNIVGEGCINGRANESAFWDDVKHLTWGRPRILYFVRCSYINVIGVSLKNTPCWTIHPYYSSYLGFYDLYIENPKDSPNTDGMDPESCDHVDIIGVRFSVGDDCIAIKSGKIYLGKTFRKPCDHICVRNCFMNEGHGALVLGSEAGAGLTNLKIERCLFHQTDRGLRIKSRRGRGKDSVMNNVVFRDIVMENVLTPFVVNMFYNCDPDGESDYVQSRDPMPVDDTTPTLGKFTFERIHVKDAEVALGYFIGLPESKIGEIEILDSDFTMKPNAVPRIPAMLCGIEKMANKGFLFENVAKIHMKNITASGYSGEECFYKNVEEILK